MVRRSATHTRARRPAVLAVHRAAAGALLVHALVHVGDLRRWTQALVGVLALALELVEVRHVVVASCSRPATTSTWRGTRWMRCVERWIPSAYCLWCACVRVCVCGCMCTALLMRVCGIASPSFKDSAAAVESALKDWAGSMESKGQDPHTSMKRAFLAMDTDNSGTLDANEIAQAIESMGVHVDKAAVLAFVDDYGSNGTVTLQQFTQFALYVPRLTRCHQAQRVTRLCFCCVAQVPT